jgi:hypothetical protein
MHEKCPRCAAPVQVEKEVESCIRCTWPNKNWDRIYVTMARRNPDGTLNKSLEGLEGFIAGLNEQNLQILSDDRGRKIQAKVFEVIMREDEMDITFEFDPTSWVEPVLH